MLLKPLSTHHLARKYVGTQVKPIENIFMDGFGRNPLPRSI